MKNQIKSDMYNKGFKNNAMTIFQYKSSRKNSISANLINVNHLISKEVKLHDERIIEQFTGTLETIVYNSLKFNKNLELSAYIGTFKNASYKDANDDLYCTTQDLIYSFQRVKFSSIEQCINFLFSLYCLIYPYNEIDLNSLHSDASVRYFINMYYKNN